MQNSIPAVGDLRQNYGDFDGERHGGKVTVWFIPSIILTCPLRTAFFAKQTHNTLTNQLLHPSTLNTPVSLPGENSFLLRRRIAPAKSEGAISRK